MRLLKFLGWTFWVLVTGFAFCTFGWTAANVPAPMNDPDYPFPPEIWTYAMGITALVMLIVCIYGLFRALDETLPEGDPCRLLS